MTKEDKDLLLKDLCARLPYGVIINTPKGDGHLCSINQTIFRNEYGVNIEATKRDYFNDDKLNFKPYFRPMSSMTEEEKREIYNLLVENDVDWFDFSKLRLDEILISFDSSWLLVNWLNAHHFDYRGLIEKGLALEAPEDMYKI